MFSSLCPTNLLRISGPFTTFGSRAFSIFPICLAIRVLPVPGGPKSRIPIPSVRYEITGTSPLTLDVLNAQLLHQTWRKNSTCKCSTEDRCKLRIQTTYAHVLELEVGSQDRIGRSSERISQSLDCPSYLFDEFLSLMPLVGSFTQITSVPSMMMPV